MEMNDPNSQRNAWPSALHRLQFMRNYLLERVRVYKAVQTVGGGQSELLEVVAQASANEETFALICAGADVSLTAVCNT